METEEIPSAFGVRVDTSRGRTPERLEAPAPPALPPPQILKTKYAAIKKLKGMSGVGWDDDAKIITMDEDAFNEYIAIQVPSSATRAMVTRDEPTIAECGRVSHVSDNKCSTSKSRRTLELPPVHLNRQQTFILHEQKTRTPPFWADTAERDRKWAERIAGNDC
ncbi:hypothetical protein Taro_042183 [Colocasia esculenta]|uniref:Myb/SANT-like domain-containing protein n=1 Tax=Colocasia esculenta TaxID=4460 RepID=A0A843WVR7_COLES|nr:hypothetical protein [Colocasia esculenta]